MLLIKSIKLRHLIQSIVQNYKDTETEPKKLK